jgi:hypothetical protein
MNGDECVRCKEIGEDRRTLFMKCLYDMDELKVPFEKFNTQELGKFYTLLVCKKCRGDWMKSIEKWYKDRPKNILYIVRTGCTYDGLTKSFSTNNMDEAYGFKELYEKQNKEINEKNHCAHFKLKCEVEEIELS